MISKLSARARREGLRSRSAYKLLEINNKYKIIRKGNSVLDLGCWPGGWMVVAKKFSGNYILGVDIKEIKSISNCEFLKADIYSEDVINLNFS